MSRYKTLFSNTLIFTISEFSSKLVMFFMLPFYTWVMTTEDFGSSDLINASIGVLMPIFTVSIADGVIRFVMKSEIDKRKVFSFGCKVILLGYCFLLLFFPLWQQVDAIKEHLLLFYLIFITSALRNYFNLFARGINKIKLVGISGILGTMVVVCSNILLLVVFRWGVTGFLLSYIISNLISGLVLFFSGEMYKYLTFENCDKKLMKELFKYSAPLVPNALSWWLNNTANRFIITAFCSIADVGLFAAASRVPTILSTLQGIFLQAWQISAISEYEKHDSEKFYADVYDGLNLITVLACSILVVFAKVLAVFLLARDFFEAWKYIPFLLVSTMFGALAGMIGTVLFVVNKTQTVFITTFIGGISAIILNYLFVPVWGPIGATFASLISYFVIWLFRLYVTMKYMVIVRNLTRDISSYGLLLVQAYCIVYLDNPAGYVGAGICFVLLVINNWMLSKKIYIITTNVVNQKWKIGV